MYHVILISLLATIMLAAWNLVHSSPRAIALFLPRDVAFVAGAALLLFGIFFAFAAAVLVQNGGAMVAFFVKAHIGLWLLLAHLTDDEVTIRRAFLMMGSIIVTIVGIFYAQDPYASAILMLLMVGVGYYLLTGSIRFLDRGR